VKIKYLTTTAVILTLGTTTLFAQESPPEKCEMCEMMKKKTAAIPQRNQQIAELDKLVSEMNGSLGSRKIEAMAAVVTRLVELYKQPPGPRPTPPPEPPKTEAHQH
jgi:hypothetical protein